MKVAVTGASGFVGGPVCARLIEARHAVRAVVRTAPLAAGVTPAELHANCDLEDEASWDRVVAGVDAVVHLAARAHVMHDDPATSDALYRRANVHVTQGLAEAAVRHGVKRFVYMSSIKVNGERTGERPFTPQDVPAPEDAYGRSKWAAEEALMRIAAGRMETVIVRPPLLYGPHMRGNMRRLFQLVQLGVPLPFASIRNARDLLYVGTLADLVAALVQHPRAAGRVFLARDGAALSTPALIAAIATSLGRSTLCIPCPPGTIRFGAKLVGAADMAARLLDDLRIDDAATRGDLGWSPTLSFPDALAETARWFKSRAS